jgi:hypothetical protein
MALVLITFHVQELREEVENWGGQARELQRVSRREVADLPPDTQVGFSITFCYGSAYPYLTNGSGSDPNPAIFVIDLQNANKKLIF